MEGEWISVSSYAKLIGRSTTFVYSLCKEGKVEFTTFNSGKYIGILIKKP